MTMCGLDFGTSNSTVGVLRNGEKAMVPLEKDSRGNWQTTLPSALFFEFENDQISFGRKAIGRYTDGKTGRLMRSMKSLLGSPYIGDSTRIKQKFYTYDDIIGFFLGSLKQQAETFLESAKPQGPGLESVVIGRPVFFNDNDPALDKAAEEHMADIARVVGFKDVSFQYEPIAAALDYEQQVRTEELALIIDIGGGTSDFTLIRLSPERHKKHDRHNDFLANHGIYLGGTNFDQQLSIAGVMPEFGLGMPMADRPSLEMPSHCYFQLATWHQIHLLYERSALLELNRLRPLVSDKVRFDRLLELVQSHNGHRLAALVEQAKIDLSSADSVEIDLQLLISEESDLTANKCTLTRQQLEKSIQRDIEKIFKALDETLQQAGVVHSDIDTVFTTGGSTALPLIQNFIHHSLPQARKIAGDLYNSVGSGLLMEAIKRYS